MISNKIFYNSVIVFLCIISLTAIYVSYTHNTILAYNDATAHLNTARRVIDNLTPGIVQLGSVWLPLLHILLLPFVASFFLWQTGLAGSIVSGLSFVIGGIFLYKLIVYTTKSSLAGIIGILLYATNINILYMQTTPMFEPLLICTSTIAVYYLTRWSTEENYLFLIFSAFFTMLATLTRYDGWAFFITMSGYVLARSIQKRKNWDGPLLAFLLLAGFGILMWFLYNYLIFSDPLYFMRGEYSAAAQQLVLAQRGQLPDKHNIILSTITYSLSFLINIGILPSAFFILGLVIYLIKNKLNIAVIAPLLLLTPYIFNIVSLYLGQSVIWLPQVPPYFHTYFNARYGILMLPAVAFFIAYLVHANKYFFYVCLFVVLVQPLFFLKPSLFAIPQNLGGIITLSDTVSSVNPQTIAASRFLHNHYKNGLVMASSASEDAFIFRAGLPLKDFITEGTGQYWKQSLKDPRTYASWIVFFNDKSDRVGKILAYNPILKQAYKLQYKDQTYQIWKRNY